jgi:hypothetical protein
MNGVGKGFIPTLVYLSGGFFRWGIPKAPWFSIVFLDFNGRMIWMILDYLGVHVYIYIHTYIIYIIYTIYINIHYHHDLGNHHPALPAMVTHGDPPVAGPAKHPP